MGCLYEPGVSESCLLHQRPISHSSVTWSHITAKKAGKFDLVVCLKEKETGLVNASVDSAIEIITSKQRKEYSCLPNSLQEIQKRQ